MDLSRIQQIISDKDKKGPGPKKSEQNGNLHPQIQEKIDYIKSPIYKRRLLALGQPKDSVDELIQSRVNALKNTSIEANPNHQYSGQAMIDEKTNKPKVIYQPGRENENSIIAHEIGHITSGLDANTRPSTYYRRPYGYYYDDIQKINNILGTGGALHMSPKEQLLFNLQNKNLNRKGHKLFGTGPVVKQSKNEYFYNESLGNWLPSGTKTDVSDPDEKPNALFPKKYGNIMPRLNDETVIVPPLKPVTKSLDVMKGVQNLKNNYIIDFGKDPINSEDYASSLFEVIMGKPDQHDFSNDENKADLDAVRYMLKKYNYTKSYGEDITPDLWQKALKDKRINQNSHIKRMRANFEDKDIINLNNRVASNKSNKKQDQA